jgi:hypothetical protein
MTYKKYITIIFLLLKSLSFGKTQLLKKYDFDKGGYSLLGIRTGAAPNDLAEKLGDFYTNDIAVLNAIKKEWTFKKSGVGFACGYHYEVIICENGFELERFSINLEITLILTTPKRFKLTTLKRSMLTTPKRSMLTT